MNMLKNLLLLTLFISTNVFADEKAETYDLNQDGIKDRFEYSVEGKVIRIEEDRDGDKKIDFKTFLNDKTYSKIQWQYSNETGKLERKTSHLLLPENKSRIINELDKDGDGVFEVKYEQVVENLQKQDHCGEVNSTIRDLSNTTFKAVAKNQKGLLPTGLGYKVDVACYSKWGDDFNKIVKEVAVGGLKCLMNLDKKGRLGTKTTGALRNAFDLTKLMKNDGISLVCSEDDYNWDGIVAHASTTSTEVMPVKNIKHPYVSLNPKHPENDASHRQKEIINLKDTLFHETLHNLGFLHNEDVEFSYTCGLCCFGSGADDPAAKEQACKVCTGNYKNVTDVNYVKDMIEFSQLTYDPARGAAAAIKYLKENKNSAGMAMLSYSTSSVFNPVGGELSKLVSARVKDLSPSDKIYLEKAGPNKNDPDFAPVQISARALSGSLYELYYNKSGTNALDMLERNKATIKQELTKMKKAPGNSVHIHDSMKKVLDGMIYDVWINKYPAGDKAASDRAYALYEFFQ
jgi:hypothetical protein